MLDWMKIKEIVNFIFTSYNKDGFVRILLGFEIVWFLLRVLILFSIEVNLLWGVIVFFDILLLNALYHNSYTIPYLYLILQVLQYANFKEDNYIILVIMVAASIAVFASRKIYNSPERIRIFREQYSHEMIED